MKRKRLRDRFVFGLPGHQVHTQKIGKAIKKTLKKISIIKKN